jgi:hypothetical protein
MADTMDVVRQIEAQPAMVATHIEAQRGMGPHIESHPGMGHSNRGAAGMLATQVMGEGWPPR